MKTFSHFLFGISCLFFLGCGISKDDAEAYDQQLDKIFEEHLADLTNLKVDSVFKTLNNTPDSLLDYATLENIFAAVIESCNKTEKKFLSIEDLDVEIPCAKIHAEFVATERKNYALFQKMFLAKKEGDIVTLTALSPQLTELKKEIMSKRDMMIFKTKLFRKEHMN